jgi:oligopeptide/dipeptide ABC transporter ATP-binding protein
MSRAAARARAIELLTLVGITAPERRIDQYPHELSGGMRQRVMIAMTLACEPELLIADEPTTALDVTIQSQILDLLMSIQEKLGLAIILITHDFGVVARLCDRVAVMYGGRIVEEGPATVLFEHPLHPYTAGLLYATPRLADRKERLNSIGGIPPQLLSAPAGCSFAPRCGSANEICARKDPLLTAAANARAVACWHPHGTPKSSAANEGSPLMLDVASITPVARGDAPPLVAVESLSVFFPMSGRGLFSRARSQVHAVEDVSFTLERGKTLGIVGESGSGKTTTGRAVILQVKASRGRIRYRGVDITDAEGDEVRGLRRSMQFVFQDPYASLNSRMKVLDIVAEPLIVHRFAKRSKDVAIRWSL